MAPDEPVLFRGDCLDELPRASELRGPFDLIYVDPPFAAGGTRGARIEKGDRQNGALAYQDAWGGLDPFLHMMEPRLALMRDALAETGSLWVHLDYRAAHDVKVLLDKLFGRSRFEGEMIWVPGNGGKRRNGPSVTHQTILIYSRTKSFFYAVDHPALREPFAETSLRMHFKSVDADGRHYRERTLGGKTYRYYADEGRKMGSVWADCPSMKANTPLNREATGYPTQKPLALLERIIFATTVEGGRVLDPMCGSGTTLAAAVKLNRQATGIDRGDVSIKTVEKRLGIQAISGQPVL